jgi:hypothetical protein
MNRTRIYLCGPVSRNPAWRQEFGRAKEELLKRLRDIEIVSPAEIDKVVVLPDTDVSLGRSAEIAIAYMLGINVISLSRQTEPEPF